jgi:hypothetical protein
MWHEWGRRGTYICYWWERKKEGNHWESQDIGSLIKLRWIDLAQDRDKWRALVNMVTNLQVP